MDEIQITDWEGVSPEAALREAIRRAGSQQKLADICGCTQGAVSQMLTKAEPRLSHQYVLVVSGSLDIPRWALRPDLYPPAEEEVPQAAAA
jgi:DNA-binding transcriptional regulator YdaS (Cro superfamily)